MTIRHELVESLQSRYAGRPTSRVSEVIAPPGGSGERRSSFTLVTLDSGAAGLCWNLLEDEPTRAAYDGLDLAGYAGRDALEVAAELLQPELVRRLVGYATCSALSQALFAVGEPAVETQTDLLDLMELSPADHVGIVGDAPPLVRDLAAGAGQVTVIQRDSRRSGPDNVRITDGAAALAGCNKVLVSSSTLLDDSFEEIERVSAGAAFRALYGPGAGILPDALFARGFQAVAGTLVLDGAALARRQRGGEKWGDAKRKFVARAQA